MQNKKNNKDLIKLLILFVGIIISTILCFVFFSKLFIKNNGTPLSYVETNTPKYTVDLKENKYYEKETLEGNMKYISSLIKNINIDFDYVFDTNESINYTNKYYIEATTKVYGDREKTTTLFDKSEKLTDLEQYSKSEIQHVELVKSVVIDYAKYNNLALNFKNEYGLANGSDLIISFKTSTVGTNSKYKGDIELNTVATVTIPLTEQTIAISLNGSKATNRDALREKFSFKNSNPLYLVLLFVFIILDIVFIVYFVNGLLVRVNTSLSYGAMLKRIKTNYDDIIADLSTGINENEYQVLYVSSFDELVDIHDNISKPIFFEEVEVGNKSNFSIIDNNKLYRYVLYNEKNEVKIDNSGVNQNNINV